MGGADLDLWCQEHLGSSVATELFRGGYFSDVTGVLLTDGRRLVVKVRPHQPRLSACWRVHSALHEAGFPAPDPVLPPTPFGPGRVATVEAYVEPEHGAGTSEASAALLAELVTLLARETTVGLEPAPAWVSWRHEQGGLWPRPDDDEVDLDARRIAWVDDIGADARRLLLDGGGAAVVGHADWVPGNVWWTRDGAPQAVHDWDSVVALPEPELAGVAAALHMAETSVEQSAAFVAAYQRRRGTWSAHDLARSWAAGLWVRLFDAKKDLLCGRTASLSEAEARRRHRLARSVRRTPELLLRPVRPADVEALVEVETDARTTRHSPTGAPSREQAEQLLVSTIDAWDRGEVGYWTVEHDGRVIGTSGLRPVTLHGRPCWNLYYRLAPHAWGRGFATQAAREAVAFAAADGPDALPVVARTRPANSAAQRVAVRAGLRRRADLDSDGFHAFASRW